MELDRVAGSEEQLVRRLKNGDADAFRELVDLYSELLLRVALRHTSNRVDAEDIVQETFEGAYLGIAKFEERSTLKSWLVGILYRRAARHHRRRKRYQAEVSMDARDIPGENGKLDSRQVSPGLALDTEAILSSLSDDHRAVVVLREVEGFTYREIAEALRIPEGTVESRLHRARQQIRETFRGYLVRLAPHEIVQGTSETGL